MIKRDAVAARKESFLDVNKLFIITAAVYFIGLIAINTVPYMLNKHYDFYCFTPHSTKFQNTHK